MAKLRLDKLLADTGRWSRKEAKELIRRGRVQVEGVLDQTDCKAFEAGVVLGDGLECLPAKLELLLERGGDWGLVTLREGKFHQIKRMLAAREKPVRYLKRLSMGGLKLDETLEKGQFRTLTPEEVEEIGNFRRILK